MGCWLQQKSMTLNDLERQFTAVLPVLCVLSPNGRTLYVSYLHIKFDDEIKVTPFEFQA